MIPLKLPMPIAIEIHNVCMNHQAPPKKKQWFQKQYSMALIPKELRMELRVDEGQHIVARQFDRRRSTRVVWNLLDDCLQRDQLTVASYETLEAVISVNQTDIEDTVVQVLRIPLHPSRLCRINAVEDPDCLPVNASVVYFSDQSIRVSPSLYRQLRNINESFVQVEEKRFADTAFYTLDDTTPPSQHDATTTTAIPSEVKLSDKPSADSILLDDLNQENDRLRLVLEQQEQWHADELQTSHNDTAALQAALEELTTQNKQLEDELARRRQHANVLDDTIRSERIRLIAETSTLYNVTDTTIRGLPIASAVSMMNHLIHIVLPKYLDVFCRPPPLNAQGQRNLIWMATLECQCRALRIPIQPDDTVLQRIQRIYQHVIDGPGVQDESSSAVGEHGKRINGDNYDDKG